MILGKQLGSLIDNLSSVYHFGKLPKSSQRKSGSKATKAYKAPKEKLLSKRTHSQKHKLLDGLQDNKKKSSPFRCRHKLKANVVSDAPDQKVQILTEDLKSDSESVPYLLADSFLPLPEKKNIDGDLKKNRTAGALTET